MGRGSWRSALAAAALAGVAVAGVVPLYLRLEPREGLRLLDPTELWLLGIFTLGMLCVLVGGSAAVGGWFRAPGLRGRLEGRPLERGGGLDAARWLTTAGVGLLGLYALAWLVAG
jgi:hypothetical protein